MSTTTVSSAMISSGVIPTVEPARNFIIDGDFTQWPEGTSATTAGNNAYGPALWKNEFSHDGAMTWERSTDVPTVDASSHQSTYSLLYKCTGADASIASGQTLKVKYFVTGSDFSALHEQTVTFSFWCKTASANSGDTYYFALQNSAENRSYVQSFAPTSTWTKFTYTIALDTSGTWLFTEATVGLKISFHLASGTDYDDATIGSWVGTNDFWASGTAISNFLDSTSNEIYFSQVGLYKGSTAPSSFVGEPVATVEDQVAYYISRYQATTANDHIGFAKGHDGTRCHLSVKYPRPMRVAPAISYSATSDIRINNATTLTDATGLSTNEISKWGYRVQVTLGSSILTNDNCYVGMLKASGDFVQFDARH
jgi:hypothetical protein